MGRKISNLTGQRFGRLVVLERANDYIKPNGSHCIRWKCKCDCGNISFVVSWKLKSGNTRSCGCMQREIAKELGKNIPRKIKQNPNNKFAKNTKRDFKNQNRNGLSKTRIYKIYISMISRCRNKNDINYKDYGGRGIKVCDEWIKEGGFEAFCRWAYNTGYDEKAEYGKCTIDRINVNGNYEPSNCRWADGKTQSNNKRNTIFISYRGKTKSLVEWCEELGLNKSTIRNRIHKGWDPEKAFSTPIRNKNR